MNGFYTLEHEPETKIKSRSGEWVSYERAFLITMGLLLSGLCGWIWYKEHELSTDWPAYAWVLFYGLNAFGFLLLVVAATATTKTVEKWAGAMSTHEATIILMIIAAPVYYVLKLLSRK